MQAVRLPPGSMSYITDISYKTGSRPAFPGRPRSRRGKIGFLVDDLDLTRGVNTCTNHARANRHESRSHLPSACSRLFVKVWRLFCLFVCQFVLSICFSCSLMKPFCGFRSPHLSALPWSLLPFVHVLSGRVVVCFCWLVRSRVGMALPEYWVWRSTLTRPACRWDSSPMPIAQVRGPSRPVNLLTFHTAHG